MSKGFELTVVRGMFSKINLPFYLQLLEQFIFDKIRKREIQFRSPRIAFIRTVLNMKWARDVHSVMQSLSTNVPLTLNHGELCSP